MSAPDSLFSQLLDLPVGASLVLPLGVSVQGAECAIASVIEQHPMRSFATGEHIARPRQGEALHNVRIERLSDET
ncbi:hypothetical protein AWB81_07181 [Caballeronia arationis]|uniref:hypothetical protein n=1 Tax=Caballeronia arationis TaxID=1777142 RepID=UPI00074BF4AD|nr:hypothetical protein [Caballeronia arationis]SAL05485.1 hypothetical protein AWB81_07181 [Caballeronia arationis]